MCNKKDVCGINGVFVVSIDSSEINEVKKFLEDNELDFIYTLFLKSDEKIVAVISNDNPIMICEICCYFQNCSHLSLEYKENYFPKDTVFRDVLASIFLSFGISTKDRSSYNDKNVDKIKPVIPKRCCEEKSK